MGEDNTRVDDPKRQGSWEVTFRVKRHILHSLLPIIMRCRAIHPGKKFIAGLSAFKEARMLLQGVRLITASETQGHLRNDASEKSKRKITYIPKSHSVQGVTSRPLLLKLRDSKGQRHEPDHKWS